MRTLWVVVVAIALLGCGGDAFEQAGSDPGGSAGSAGSAVGGTGGTAGSETGGSAGIAGSAGSGGTEVGGSAGSEQGGSGGSEMGGSAGAQGGSAGSAGATGGSAGQAGSGGTPTGGSGGATTDPDGYVLAVNLDDPAGIAMDDSTVFWTNQAGGMVESMPLNGGSETTLAAGQSMPTHIIEDGAVLYWANLSGSIMAMNKNGTGINTIAIGSFPMGLAQNSTKLFWANGGGTPIQFVTKGSTTIQNLPAAGGFPTDVTVDEENVYWTSGNAIRRYDMSVNKDYLVASNENDPGAIAVDGTWIYWVERGDSYDDSTNKCEGVTGTIKAARINDFTDTKIIATGQACPMDLLVDAGTVYWTNGGSYDGVVYQDNGAVMQEYGSGPQVLAANQRRPYKLAVNATKLAWTSTGLFSGQGTVRITNR